jgi:hypothetical protein
LVCIHRKLFELWPFPSNHCRSLFSDIGLFSAHAAHAAHAAAATAAAAALHTLPCTWARRSEPRPVQRNCSTNPLQSSRTTRGERTRFLDGVVCVLLSVGLDPCRLHVVLHKMSNLPDLRRRTHVPNEGGDSINSSIAPHSRPSGAKAADTPPGHGAKRGGQGEEPGSGRAADVTQLVRPVRCRNTVWTCPVPDTLEFFVKHARSASKSFNIVPRRTKIALDPHDRRESRMNLEAKKSRMNLEVKRSTGCF